LIPTCRVSSPFVPFRGGLVRLYQKSAGGAYRRNWLNLRKRTNKNNAKIGIPIAGDDQEALKAAGELVKRAGLDPVVVGSLSTSKSFDVGSAVYASSAAEGEIRKRLNLKPARSRRKAYPFASRNAGDRGGAEREEVPCPPPVSEGDVPVDSYCVTSQSLAWLLESNTTRFLPVKLTTAL